MTYLFENRKYGVRTHLMVKLTQYFLQNIFHTLKSTKFVVESTNFLNFHVLPLCIEVTGIIFSFEPDNLQPKLYPILYFHNRYCHILLISQINIHMHKLKDCFTLALQNLFQIILLRLHNVLSSIDFLEQDLHKSTHNLQFDMMLHNFFDKFSA